MANGADTDEYVVLSKVRPGLKRELAFALKSQAEYGASYGRSRTRRSQTGDSGYEVLNDGSSKRFKSSQLKDEGEKSPGDEFLLTDTENSMHVGVAKWDLAGYVPKEKAISVSEDEPKSDVVDIASDDEHRELSVESAIKLVSCSEVPDIEDGTNNCSLDMYIGGGLMKEGLESPSPMEPDILSLKSYSIEKDYSEKPTRRVSRSAVKVMEEPLEILTPAYQRTEEALKNSAISRKIELRRFPTKLKELLETGLLEGLPVRYIRGVKSRSPSDTGMQGIIKDAGILCYCSLCLGAKVVTPNQFELHAGSSNKRPPEYIFLENGKTLRDVLNACKVAPLESLEEAICKVAGCSSETKSVFCLICKGTISEVGSARAMLICSQCLKTEEPMQISAPSSDSSDSFRSPSIAVIPKSSGSVSSSVLRLPPTAVIPKASENSCGSSRSKPQGRLTRKDSRMHKLVFQDDVLPDGTELAYYSRGQNCARGYKKGAGIFCFCCQSESLEAYYQEAGRAGRDGKLADCTLYANLSRTPSLLPSKRSKGQEKQAKRMLSDCFRYGMNTTSCRAKILVEYFGEAFGTVKCRMCDICVNGPPEILDFKAEADAFMRVLATHYGQGNFAGSSYYDEAYGRNNQGEYMEKLNIGTLVSKIREQFEKFVASDKLWWQGFARILEDKGFIREAGDMVQIQIKFPEPTKRGLDFLKEAIDNPFNGYPEADMLLSMENPKSYSSFSEWGKGWANPEIRRQRLGRGKLRSGKRNPRKRKSRRNQADMKTVRGRLAAKLNN